MPTNRDTLEEVRLRTSALWILIAAGSLLPLAASCEEDLGADHCEEPGSSTKCACSDGRSSLRTCDAFNTLGPCFCNTTGCGNGQVEMGEQCDDGNLDGGDGCDENCLLEGQGGNGPGPGPGPGPGGFGGSFGGMGGIPGGMGGMPGGMGGGGAPGGMGGLGGN